MVAEWKNMQHNKDSLLFQELVTPVEILWMEKHLKLESVRTSKQGKIGIF